jgi:hypothetical protein
MDTFRRSALAVAVLAGLAEMSSTAEAAHLSSGPGFIYPYYTVPFQGEYIWLEYLSRVDRHNSRAQTLAAEVVDFNLYLPSVPFVNTS